jgi:hypothetical protein
VKAGIFTIPAAEYHADPCDEPSLSSSIAKLICSRSPRHAWTAHPRLNPSFERKQESKFDLGTAAHAILLEAKPFEHVVEVVYADAWRTNAAKELAAEAREAGKVPLLEKEVDGLTQMLEATRYQLEAIDASPAFFADGKPEQTLIWEENGVTCRALIDWLRDDYTAIDDYKTTSASADPEKWTRTLFTIGADVQTAFYRRGVRALTGIEPELRYIVQETYPPYALSVVSVGPDVLAVADDKVEYAIACWRTSLASGVWPGYASEIAYADLPAWEEARWMEKTMREEIAA